MKILRVLIVIICFLATSPFSFSQRKQTLLQNNRRVEKIINSGWTFNYFSKESSRKNYEAFGFDDSRWPAITLPHVWRTYETTGEMHPYLLMSAEDDNMYWWTGWGWYRKHFALNREYFGRKVFIEFEGVQKNCRVWLNGKLLGEHNGSAGSFDFDITQIVKPEGSDNVLAVEVNNFQEGTTPYLADDGGNFYEYGGIFRNVKLVLKDQMYIPMQGSASHEGGTFITTPSVTEKEAVVRVRTWVKNDYPVKKNCTLRTTILDAANKEVQVISSESSLNPGQLFMFDQTLKPIKSPRLWSPENPYLYSVRSEIIDGNSVIDVYSSPLGIRSIKWDNSSNTLSVNGKKISLKGGSRRQDFPWLGAAVPGWLILMDMQFRDEKEGSNFLQTVYNQDNRLVYEQADRYGFIIAAEVAGIYQKNLSAQETEQITREMIRANRNHPSLIFWSFGDKTLYDSGSKVVMAEDPDRVILQGRIKPETTISGSMFENKNVPASGDAARIILNSTHSKIVADRGSVAIINADVTDQNGNKVKSDPRNMRWDITGPATLVGPVDFVAEGNGNTTAPGGWYSGFPATNIIRSTGVAGKINVTLYSSGLASGNIEIISEEYKPDNSVIAEPLLSDEGRKPVARLIINLNRLDEIKREIDFIKEPVSVTMIDKEGMRKEVRDFIFRKNPSVDTASTEFRALADILSVQLLNNGGKMSAGDYNYNIDHFNNCRLIYSYIMATKIPPVFKESLRKYYARSVITRGSEKNAGDEMNWLNWIPSGGQVVFVQDESTKTGIKGVVNTKNTDLSEIITLVYPQFKGFSEYGKERALIFISKMNPYVDAVKSGEQISYTARRGELVLIPLYKFISE